ncbi:CaiB/BaiF CoA transferase family protein [Actinoallomurus soli]|uniref:CaiB/BaiF CoA transferase family protein n=1 Tax=Actinoallomurus soli TaxID=2952535 RepID=UPI002092EA04|nr:CoA transferase [Actinoallomurus soli]MCO5968565.1 CoA transferase [Actinoallomurus soli]
MGLLDGLRVLDLTRWRPGPYATQLLAQLGADVLKVEPPGGEPMRAFPSHFELLNRNKRSVVIDLPAGAARCLELAAGADVLIEGYRPGVADRLGVGHDAVRAVNPRIVYCSISGYGASGPLASLPGHDVNYRAYAGVAPPEDGGHEFPVADMAAATMAAFAITAACHKGRGERIDLGMADVLANWMSTVPVSPTPDTARPGEPVPDTAARPWEPAPGAARPEGPVPGTAARPVGPAVGVVRARGPVPGYGVYPARDGAGVSLGVVSEDRLWAATCRALELDRHAGLSFAERLSRAEELDRDLAGAVAGLPRATAVARLTAAGAPVAPVLSPAEMRTVDHFRRRGVLDGSPVRTIFDPPPPPGRAPDLGGARGWAGDESPRDLG